MGYKLIYHYFITSVRFLLWDKTTSVVCILSLALSIGCCAPIYYYLHQELTYDHFHKKFDRIYQVYLNAKEGKETGLHYPATEALQEEFPEFELVTQMIYGSYFFDRSKIIIEKSETSRDIYAENNVLFVDPNFFRMFDFQLLTSIDYEEFSKSNRALLTPVLAKKYFGTLDVVGKTMRYEDLTLEIIGLVAEPPNNTSLKYSFLVSYATHMEMNRDRRGDWLFYGGPEVFVLLNPGVNTGVCSERLISFTEDHVVLYDPENYHYDIRSLGEVYLDGSWTRFMMVLVFLGITLLMIGVVNYSNLTAGAFSVRIAWETSIRRVLGSQSGDIVLRLLVQHAILVLLALVISMGMALWILSMLDLTPRYMAHYADIALFLVAMGLIVVLIAVVYPSLVLSGILPNDIYRGYGPLKRYSFTGIRKIMLVIQISASIFLLVSALVVYLQIRSWSQTDLLFRTKDVITLSVPMSAEAQKEQLKNDLLRIPGIEQVAYSSGIPNDLKWGGILGHQSIEAGVIAVDKDFYSLYNLNITRGRVDAGGVKPEVWINERYQELLESDTLQEIIGQEVTVDFAFSHKVDGIVAGVIKDYITGAPMDKSIDPLVMVFDPSHSNMVNIAITGNEVNRSEIIQLIKVRFQKSFPYAYFEPIFIEDRIRFAYIDEDFMGASLHYACLIALIICCIGIFGLVRFITIKNQKEYAIRKVHGASQGNITALILGSLGSTSLIGFLFGSCTAYWVLQDWLSNYVNHIEIHPMYLVGCIVFLVLLILATVIKLIFNIASENPIKYLKDI